MGRARIPGVPRPAAPDKPRRVLEAAQRLFSRYGFRRTSVDDIAREAGIAKGTVYLAFPGKEALFCAVAAHLFEEVLGRAREAAAGAGSLESRVLAVLDAKYRTFFEVVHASPHAAELLDSTNALGADLYAKAEREFHRLLAALLAEGQRTRELDLRAASLSAADAAWLLMRGAKGCAAPDSSGAPPALAAYKRRLSEMTRILLRGMGSPGRKELR